LFFNTGSLSTRIPKALYDDEDGLPLATNWLAVNGDLLTPMRVDYDDTNWNSIITQLHSDHHQFSVYQRVQFLIDIHLFASSIAVRLPLFIRLYAYISNERNLAPIQTALGRMHATLKAYESTDVFPMLALYWKSAILSVSSMLEHMETHTQRTMVVEMMCLVHMHDECSLSLAQVALMINAHNDGR
jgi:hypothetical protein